MISIHTKTQYMNNQLFKFSALSLSSLSLKLSEIERCRLLFAGIFFRPRFPLFGLWSPASDDFFSIVLDGSCLRESVAPLAPYSSALIRICSGPFVFLFSFSYLSFYDLPFVSLVYWSTNRIVFLSPMFGSCHLQANLIFKDVCCWISEKSGVIRSIACLWNFYLMKRGSLAILVGFDLSGLTTQLLGVCCFGS